MKFTHLHIFLIGWIYYLIIPLILAYFSSPNPDESELWLKYVDTNGPWWWALPFYVMLMPIAFLAGDRVSRLSKVVRPRAVRIRVTNQLLLPLNFLLLIIFAVPARSMLFSGYLEGYDSAIMGPIATLEMVVLFQYILCKSSGMLTMARLNLILLFLCSLVLLGMGGRLYVASSIAAIIFYSWKFCPIKKPSLVGTLFFISVAVVSLGAIGMVRMGFFSPGLVVLYVFTESLLTSISAFSAMAGGEWALFEIPSNFIYSFINVVPSWVWEGKAEFLSSLIVERLDIASPFGAKSAVASAVENFGFIGGLVFTGLVGFVMGRSQLRSRSPLGIALYCYLTGLLLFVFFRDPFSIQVKLVLTGFLLVWIYNSVSLLMVSGNATAVVQNNN